MKICLTYLAIVITVMSTCQAYGSESITNRNNGARIAAAGLFSLAIMAAFGW